jgi:conjugative relaxase-like TrwC/TraI family protein
VLKIHVVRQGGHHYYVDDLVPGRAEGTLVAGEEPGRWAGSGSEALGLRGVVESQAFAEVLAGRDPVSERSLCTDRGGIRVAGYDLTFAAPKSVSLLHLLAPREIAAEVGAGHRAAVDEAIQYLGRSAVGVRRSRGGQVAFLPSTGAVAGVFLHRTSRALDPHLHSHAVTANVAQGVDGEWSAVDSRRVFSHAQAAQALYHARLRFELAERIGATWEVPRSGLGDVIGVERSLRRLFSQRSAAMDEFDVRRGSGTGPRRSQGAYHATRPDKDRQATVESLIARWKERAADFGIDLGNLTQVIGPRRTVQVGNEIDPDRVRTRLSHVTRAKDSIARRDLVAVVADAATTGAPARVIESVASRITDASGPPIGRGRFDQGLRGATDRGRQASGMEPRWSASVVARAVERRPEELLGLRSSGPERAVQAEPPAPARGRTINRGLAPAASFELRCTQEESQQLAR